MHISQAMTKILNAVFGDGASDTPCQFTFEVDTKLKGMKDAAEALAEINVVIMYEADEKGMAVLEPAVDLSTGESRYEDELNEEVGEDAAVEAGDNTGAEVDATAEAEAAEDVVAEEAETADAEAEAETADAEAEAEPLDLEASGEAQPEEGVEAGVEAEDTYEASENASVSTDTPEDEAAVTAE